jgi:GNAT superfamily N-acetyltransferase
MAKLDRIRVDLLKREELPEADRICRLAFGTFLGLPDPMVFMGDRQFIASRWRGKHVTALAARHGGRLIGTSFLTRWGSFAFFGPLTVLPEFWDRGVAQALLEATVARFDREGLKRTALFTFPHSTKHVGLYRKFGYWPAYLTSLMRLELTPDLAPNENAPAPFVHLSKLKKTAREEAIAACRRLTHRIDKGLDLRGEMQSILAQKIGDVLLNSTRATLDSFAICCHGDGSEGGAGLCYVKFAAARPGAGAGGRFDRLLDSIAAFAASRGVPVETGVNMAREDAFRRMAARGYKTFAQGVAMQRPHAPGYNRADAYVLDDWR